MELKGKVCECHAEEKSLRVCVCVCVRSTAGKADGGTIEEERVEGGSLGGQGGGGWCQLSTL